VLIRTFSHVSQCLLLNCSFPGAEKAAECSKMVSSLDALQEELFNLIATGELLDKSNQSEMQGWIKSAGDAIDLAVNACSLGKANKVKFQNYLSS